MIVSLYMRILAEKYGRLHVNVFHNRIQFFMRDGRRWLSIFFYHNRQAGDYTQSARTIPRETVRAIFRWAFASKRFSADQSRWIPDEVLVWLKCKWGSGSLKGRPKKRAKSQLVHVIGPATATEIRRMSGITKRRRETCFALSGRQG